MFHISVDSSPNTFWEYRHWNKVPENRNLQEPKVTIAQTLYTINPAAKIILILRNPVTRYFSDYMRMYGWGMIKQSFDEGSQEMVHNFTRCSQEASARRCALSYWNRTKGVRPSIKSF